MENKLPMIKKEGFISKIFNRLKKYLGKKETTENNTSDEIKQLKPNTLTILDKNKGIEFEVNECLTDSLQFVLDKSGIQVTEGKIDLTNMPLELQNNFLEKLISQTANFMCIIFDDELINNNEVRNSQKKEMFHQINFTLNLPRSMERRGEKMPDDRKNNMYFGMLNNIFDYVRETVEYLDEQILNQNDTRKQFLRSIEQHPSFVDPNNITQGNGEREEEQK